MKVISPAVILALAPLLSVVTALPAPQQSASGSSCDTNCNAVLSAANTCSTLPATQQGACLCDSNGFLNAAEICYACDGGTVFAASGLYYISVAIEGCGGTVPSVSSSAVTAVSTSQATTGASRTGAATSLAGGVQAVPVTEDPTQPISFEAWAPSGFSPTLTYHIEETGGQNTTIAAVQTLTITADSITATATVTVGFIMDSTQIVQVQGNDGYNDYTFCRLVNATTGDCIELAFDGTSLTASTRYTLQGATSTWVAYPSATGLAIASSSPSSATLATSPTQATASGTAVGGTIGGIVSSSAAASSASF